MLISVLLIFSSPSFETDVSSRWRFFLMTSSSTLLDSLLVVVEVEADAVGFWLDPRERGVESFGTSFDGVEEREVDASSNVSLKMGKKKTNSN